MDRTAVGRILLAADDSPGAERARQLLSTLHLTNVDIRVVRALGPVPTLAGLTDALHEQLVGTALNALEAEVQAFSEPLRPLGARVGSQALLGRAASVIVDEAERWRADLIVLGSHGRRAVASAILGSVAAEVSDHARCAVLVARTDHVRHIVLADDGSRDAESAARLVASGLFDAEVRVVSVAHISKALASGVSIAVRDEVRRMEDEVASATRRAHREVLERRAQAFRDSGMTASTELREGVPADEIIGAAAAFDADLIAVGTRGMTGLRRLLLGSVARNVLYHAACSVLIARAAE